MIRVYVVAIAIMFSGVPVQISSVFENKAPTIVAKIPPLTVSTSDIRIDSFSFFRSPAPKFCDTTTVAPVEIPVNSPISRLLIGL